MEVKSAPTYPDDLKVKDIIEGGHISAVKFNYNEIRLELSDGHELHAYATKDSMGQTRLSVDVMKKVITKVAGVDLDEC
ncbi:hypothetical protein [Bacillus altitudinis]|uniref:hypothetical protein n=1 Tax=Bacillus altitudinis TaxID=293387 RepID=UPI0021007249|nr:hypothetical protein [Bacillus altitudinis]UTV34816.1 hypothetical protein NM966_19680 [Bacillus altitudinis]